MARGKGVGGVLGMLRHGSRGERSGARASAAATEAVRSGFGAQSRTRAETQDAAVGVCSSRCKRWHMVWFGGCNPVECRARRGANNVGAVRCGGCRTCKGGRATAYAW